MNRIERIASKISEDAQKAHEQYLETVRGQSVVLIDGDEIRGRKLGLFYDKERKCWVMRGGANDVEVKMKASDDDLAWALDGIMPRKIREKWADYRSKSIVDLGYKLSEPQEAALLKLQEDPTATIPLNKNVGMALVRKDLAEEANSGYSSYSNRNKDEGLFRLKLE